MTNRQRRASTKRRQMPAVAREAPSGGVPPFVRSAGIGALFLLTWVGLVEPPAHVRALDFDDSWGRALAHFMRNGCQAGRDYIFTYGPLGYFGTKVFAPELFVLRYAWEVIVGLALAVFLVRTSRRQTTTLSRWLLGYLLVTTTLSHVESRYGLGLLVAFLWLLEEEPGPIPTVACYALIAAAGLLKFTLLILAVWLGGVLAVSLMARGQWRRGLTHLGLFAGLSLLLWLILGQSPANVPAYLRGSWELSRAYSTAMVLATGASPQTPVALALAGLGIFCIGWQLWKPGGGARGWAAGAMVLGTLFLAWKESFVREDIPHRGTFFSLVIFLPFVVFAAPGHSSRRGWIEALAAFLIAAGGVSQLPALTQVHPERALTLTGLWAGEVERLVERGRRLGENGAYLFTPWSFCAARQAELQDLQQHARLPRIRETIGAGSVDCFAFQVLDALEGGMNWAPRPVFQSYLGYTPYLLERNRDFLRSDQAPEFVILNSRQIDDRLFMGEDSLAYLEVCRQYTPVRRGAQVLREEDALLFQRLPEGERGQLDGQELMRRTFRLGEPVPVGELAGSWKTLSVRLRPTLWGRVRAFLYHAPPVLTVVTCRQPTTGRTGRTPPARLVPSIDGEEFLIDPLITDYLDFPDLYEPDRAARTQSLVVITDPACFEPTFEVMLRAYPHLVRRPGTSSPPDRDSGR